MFYIKFMLTCASLLLAFNYTDAQPTTKRKLPDEKLLQTYIIEPSVTSEQSVVQQYITETPQIVSDVTSEKNEKNETLPEIVDVDASLDVNVDTNSEPNLIPNSESNLVENSDKNVNNVVLPQESVQQYANPNVGTYYPPSYGGYYYPYQMPYFPQSNAPYAAMQPHYEGILVPVQTSNYISSPPSPPPPMQENAQQNNQQNSQQYGQVIPETQQMEQQQQRPQQPQTLPQMNKDERVHNKSPSQINSDLVVLLRNVLPPNVVNLIAVWGTFVLNMFSMVAFAGLITTAICSLTPLCTISFGALPFGLRNTYIAKTNGGTEILTVDRVKRAAEFVSSAIDKYEQIQKGIDFISKKKK